MGKFSFEDADNYGSQGNGSFFQLKDDHDTAKVRFLYDGIDDVEGYAVHEVHIGDKRRYVNCLRSYNDPIDKCPFCQAQMKVIPKLFLKLYNEDAGEVQIWERGKKYFQRMGSLATHYKPLYNQVIEIERNGAKGDMKTTYEFYPDGESPIDINDEKYDCPDPLGTIILDKNADDMNYFLDNGDFPTDSEAVADERSARRGGRGSEDMPTGRRTPSNRRAF